jgi:hypothetical protein
VIGSVEPADFRFQVCQGPAVSAFWGAWRGGHEAAFERDLIMVVPGAAAVVALFAKPP